MSGILIESGEAAAIELLTKLTPDLGKMLGAALGGGIGAGAYRYFQPHFAGRGFDQSKGSARKSGIATGRAIAGGNVERVHQTKSSIAETATSSYRQYKKLRPIFHGRANKHRCCHPVRSRC